jgi:hypothetical protein
MWILPSTLLLLLVFMYALSSTAILGGNGGGISFSGILILGGNGGGVSLTALL